MELVVHASNALFHTLNYETNLMLKCMTKDINTLLHLCRYSN
jgi:hypothetical protein